jgi:hypothetical protein
MIIDGLIMTEAIDRSGEVVALDGCDCSSIDEKTAYANYEHLSGDSGSPVSMVGKIIYYKKLFKEADCENARQLKFYKQVDLPCLYAIIRLSDTAGHTGAAQLAASIRDELKNDGEIKISFSIEGSTLKRVGQRLTSTIIRGVAITFKPANRSVQTGILSDPTAPPGFDTNPEGISAKEKKDWMSELADSKKSERNPDAMVLSGFQNTFTELPDDLLKATEAGNYNAAPSTLTGGAALQVEDPSLRKRYLKNQALAALRDWDKSEPFKKFLKHRLPEADDEFIDRFSEMVEEFRMKKAEKVEVDEPDEISPPSKDGPLSIMGKPVPATNVDKPVFDEKSGVLHTPRGSFPMYIPHKDPSPGARESFGNIMQDPTANKIHGYAFDNWKKAHHLLKAGKLPEQVIMHAVLFSNLSPNTPVPAQERMYGHLVDTMNRTGIDARSPQFHTIKDHWLGSDSPTTYPEHSRAHFERFDSQLRIKNDSKLTGRKAGDIGGFMLANDKFENMSQYQNMHEKLKDLVSRHGTDARSATSEMMRQKEDGKKWNNKRKTAIASGRADPGEYPGIPIKGLAPKTSRYMYGMMGGGNVVVPDTHFVRYLFGLEKNKDTQSINYIKSLLWNEQNSHLLEGIDRHYVANHDAVKHMSEHPDAQGIDPKDLAFPAFWRNWMAIVPHEKARNMRTGGYNEGTDHKPFWDAISQYIDTQNNAKKSDQDAWSKALDTAKQHLHWQETFGEHPAMLMYMSTLLPELLGGSYESYASSPSNNPSSLALQTGQDVAPEFATDPNGSVSSPVIKMELLAIKLNLLGAKLQKAQEDVAPQQEPETVEWQGKKVKPGILNQYNGPKWKILGHDDTHFHVIHHSESAPTASNVNKMSKMGHGASYRVKSWPEVVDSGAIVDHSKHGHALNTSAKQIALVHGLDFSTPAIQGHGGTGDNYGTAHWRNHPNGTNVYLKGDATPTDFPSTRKEVSFHNLARDVFGLGHMIPNTAVVKHPQTGQELAAIEKIKGGTHYDHSNEHKKALEKIGDSGDLDKASLMDWVLGMDDRHEGNWMLGDKGQLHLLDHGEAFAKKPDALVEPPNYLERYWKNKRDDDPDKMPGVGLDQKIHPEAQVMARKLDPNKLADKMRAMGIPERYVNSAHQRASFLRASADSAGSNGKVMLAKDIFDGSVGGSNE